MKGELRFMYKPSAIGFPVKLTRNIPSQHASDHGHAWEEWRGRVLVAASKNKTLRHLTFGSTKDGFFLSERDGVVILSEQITIDAQSPVGSLVLPNSIDRHTEGLQGVDVSAYVYVPLGEGYVRGAHREDETVMLVEFDPTEKVGLARYRFAGTSKTWDPLAKLFGEILTGRKPEIVHSHRI